MELITGKGANIYWTESKNYAESSLSKLVASSLPRVGQFLILDLANN